MNDQNSTKAYKELELVKNKLLEMDKKFVVLDIPLYLENKMCENHSKSDIIVRNMGSL